MKLFKDIIFKKHPLIEDAEQGNLLLDNGYEAVISFNKRYFNGEDFIHKGEGHEYLPILGNIDYKDKEVVNETYQLMIFDEEDEFFVFEHPFQVGKFYKSDQINSVLKNIQLDINAFNEKNTESIRKKVFDYLGITYE